ncbi:MAG: hypothetical protein KA490_07365 [Giesbergeria sp.]|nr:hypothetical protein [Giesbergeria sp.]
MSILSWFTRKSAPVPARNMEPSGLLNPEATIPLVPGLYGRQMPEPAAPEHAANRKNERMERRELLYTVVRDAMVRAGVLSASYKFKVLSLDQRGSQFLVMMDLAREFGGDTARLSEIEALIAQTAKSRYDIAVTAVYWRSNEHVAVGNPQKTAAAPRPAPAAGNTRPGPIAAAPAPLPRPALRPVPAAFDPIEADEVAAFKKALSSSATGDPARPKGVPVRTGPLRRPRADDFADTEMPQTGPRGPDLSGTQYGDL